MDIIIQQQLSDDRSWSAHAEKKFKRNCFQLCGKKGASYNADYINAFGGMYRLMIVLHAAIKDGHLEYIGDYLKVSASFRDSLKMLQLPAKLIPQIVKDEDKESNQSALDLSKLSLEELRALRKIILKGSGQVVEDEKPQPLMIAHKPLVEELKEEPRVKRTKQPKSEIIDIEPTAISPQGETPEEREERIQYHHWLKMRTRLQKDPDPWDL